MTTKSSSSVKRRVAAIAAATILVIAGPTCGSASAETHHPKPDFNLPCFLFPWRC